MDTSSVTMVFPHKQGEIGLQQRASIVIQTGHHQVPVAITIRAVDMYGEEVKLCPKQKKDHEYVTKTLNEELFQGGAKADVTFYCKGANTGGCKTKKPSKLRLCAVLVYENGSFHKFFSANFLVKGNRRTQSKIHITTNTRKISSPTTQRDCGYGGGTPQRDCGYGTHGTQRDCGYGGRDELVRSLIPSPPRCDSGDYGDTNVTAVRALIPTCEELKSASWLEEKKISIPDGFQHIVNPSPPHYGDKHIVNPSPPHYGDKHVVNPSPPHYGDMENPSPPGGDIKGGLSFYPCRSTFYGYSDPIPQYCPSKIASELIYLLVNPESPTRECSVPYTQECGIPYTHECSIPCTHECSVASTHECSIPYAHECSIPYTHECGIPCTLDLNEDVNPNTYGPFGDTKGDIVVPLSSRKRPFNMEESEQSTAKRMNINNLINPKPIHSFQQSYQS